MIAVPRFHDGDFDSIDVAAHLAIASGLAAIYSSAANRRGWCRPEGVELLSLGFLASPPLFWILTDSSEPLRTAVRLIGAVALSLWASMNVRHQVERHLVGPGQLDSQS